MLAISDQDCKREIVTLEFNVEKQKARFRVQNSDVETFCGWY